MISTRHWKRGHPRACLHTPNIKWCLFIHCDRLHNGQLCTTTCRVAECQVQVHHAATMESGFTACMDLRRAPRRMRMWSPAWGHGSQLSSARSGAAAATRLLATAPRSRPAPPAARLPQTSAAASGSATLRCARTHSLEDMPCGMHGRRSCRLQDAPQRQSALWRAHCTHHLVAHDLQ